MRRPAIGITMGDAAGIGPEIILKALSDTTVYEHCRPCVIGDARILERAETIVRTGGRVRRIRDLSQASFEAGIVDCLDLDLLTNDLPFGRVCAAAGEAAFQYLKCAVELARTRQIDAIVTAPVNKEALHAAGHRYPGQTEILATLTGTTNYALMMAAPTLKVILVTLHVGLADALRLIEPGRVYAVIELAHATLRRAGCTEPRIAVCGVNPHAGEKGLFGHREEEEKIIPAIERARRSGIRVSGPWPADSVFARAHRGEFDVVVAMYHDQGLAPIKTVAWEEAVNITVGLPIVRTSVGHGTAYDIAGRGTASARNLQAALRYAIEMSRGEDGHSGCTRRRDDADAG
ncbi:MAG TPA: 4-hydroxythreonine-4-phosphate dehydrogenase PdxA [Blastocatellia bacterium]|nr:4-hydroxythreonine-4-phosphate dehydrogenase PdxA [Blastocatellia bacterium]